MRHVGGWGAGAWSLATTGVLALVWAVATPLVGRVASSSVPLRPSPPFSVSPYAADSLAEVVVARDLFRADRRPARVAYNPSVAAAPSPVLDVPK
ncbi:MAG: hypothetical protein ACREMR_00375, partial [Gemmatimonadales bacterium]